MNTLTREQKARLFAKYIGQAINSLERSGNVTGIGNGGMYITWPSKVVSYCRYNSIKLLLTPLDQISDEDIRVVADLMIGGIVYKYVGGKIIVEQKKIYPDSLLMASVLTIPVVYRSQRFIIKITDNRDVCFLDDDGKVQITTPFACPFSSNQATQTTEKQ